MRRGECALLAGVQGVELLLPEGLLAVHVLPVRRGPFGPNVGCVPGFGFRLVAGRGNFALGANTGTSTMAYSTDLGLVG